MIKNKKFKDYKVNDLFMMEYGFNSIRFRVDRVLEGALLVHSTRWMKSSSIIIKENEREMTYIGKMSKFKAFFLT